MGRSWHALVIAMDPSGAPASRPRMPVPDVGQAADGFEFKDDGPEALMKLRLRVRGGDGGEEGGAWGVEL